jgi:hypothetical protein
MKQALLFVILAFSINAFAQHTPVLNHQQDPKVNSIKNTKGHLHLPAYLQSLVNTSNQKSADPSSRSVFDLVQLIDSAYAWGWDTLGAKLTLESKTTDITYNAANLPLSFTFETWNGSSWDKTLQFVFTYDANNNVTAQIFKSWNGSSWTNYFQTVYTYDGNNNQVTELTQLWTGFSWLNLSYYLYTYDANHHLLTETDQTWTGTAWLNDYKYTYTYSGDNQTSVVTQYWDDVNAVWINSGQELYTYDGNHHVLTYTNQVWNGLSWDNVSLSTYTYDGNGNQLTDLEQSWDGTGWVNISKTTNTYNGSNLLTNSLTQNWNGASYDNAGRTTNTYSGTLLTKSLFEIWDGSSWKYSTVSFYSYDADGFVTGEGTREYDGVDNLITSGDSTHYFFRTVVGTKDVNEDATLSISPNPNSGKFTLTSETGIGTVTIYNSTGARVYFDDKANGQTRSDINLEGYSSGMYMAIIKNGNTITTRKILIQ